jgi:hypothetical protein
LVIHACASQHVSPFSPSTAAWWLTAETATTTTTTTTTRDKIDHSCVVITRRRVDVIDVGSHK